MAKYKVYWNGLYSEQITMIEAENKNKATYKLFKQLLGVEIIKECKFIDFIKYYYSKTIEVKDGN